MKLSPVIASQRVGAKRRPMTGSAKQSMYPRVLARMDCLVAEFIIGPAEGGTRWLLAMTEGAAGSVIAHPTTRHPEVAASSAALEGRRCGSAILRGSQELAPQDDAVAIIARSGSDEAIHFSVCGAMDCFAEPVIGRRFAPTRWLAMTQTTIQTFAQAA